MPFSGERVCLVALWLLGTVAYDVVGGVYTANMVLGGVGVQEPWWKVPVDLACYGKRRLHVSKNPRMARVSLHIDNS